MRVVRFFREFRGRPEGVGWKFDLANLFSCLDWPGIPAIVQFTDLSLEICIECGKVYGFDKDAVRAAINRLEIDNNAVDEDGIGEEDY